MKPALKRSDQELLFDIELLTIQQVAKWAKVSPKSVYRWIEAGKSRLSNLGSVQFEFPPGPLLRT
jgi:hypothetical protein